MPRRLRVHLPGGFYHVTLRGNHQHDIFFAEEDRALLNLITARAIATYDARLHAYCWMTNHLHFLVQVGLRPLSEPMRNIASEFARAMQIKLATTGHYFERRYHATVVDTDSYLKELVRYIHLNPVSAGVATDPARYPWSSHHAYVGSRSESWLTTEFALSMFGQTRERAIDAYRAFVRAEDALEWEPRRMIGAELAFATDRFTAEAMNASVIIRTRQTLPELVEEACRRFEVNAPELGSTTRNPYLSKVRAWIANHAVKRRVATLATVARLLARNEATLREAIRRYPKEVE
jgi:putative transposase